MGPFSSAKPPPPTPSEVMASYRPEYDRLFAEGKIKPYVTGYNLLPLVVVVLYLCIDHRRRPWVYRARWLVLAWVFWFEIKAIGETRSLNMATGFGAGVIDVWAMVWSTTWLVLRRPLWDAARIERRRVGGKGGESEAASAGGESTGSNGHASGSGIQGNGDVVRRKLGDGESKDVGSEEKLQKNAPLQENEKSAEDGKDGAWEYYWQAYPDTFLERLDWVTDLCSNFRGTGWTWAVSTVPSPPADIVLSLSLPRNSPQSRSGPQTTISPPTFKSLSPTTSVGTYRYDSRRSLFNGSVPFFLIGYFVLDAFKTTMTHDPYFLLGPELADQYALPPHLANLPPWLLTAYRRNLTFAAILLSLEMLFVTAPMILCLLLGPRILGPRGEVWQYPTRWGSPNIILTRGLAGLWGGYWHQTFRSAFEAPTEFLLRKQLFGIKSSRDWKAKLLGTFAAFGISGILHAGGSLTQWPKTYASHAPLFFAAQGVGILVQNAICKAVKTERFPGWARKVGNFGFAFGWLYGTAWLLIDDFARGGVWLYEPVPFSVFRGLGFGAEGESWWCWGPRDRQWGFSWYSGKDGRWWESGFAM